MTISFRSDIAPLRGLWLLLALTLGAFRPAASQEVAARPAPATNPVAVAAATITAQDVFRHISYLASDELKGRDTPSPGLEETAAYLVGELRSYGLRPAGEDGGFLQRYPFQVRAVDPEGTRFEATTPAGVVKLRYGTDFFADPGAAERAAGALVFAGSAADAEGAGTVPRGAISVVDLPGTGGPAWERGVGRTREAAHEAGAAAVVFVLDPTFTPAMIERTAEYLARPRREMGELPPIAAYFVGDAAARRLLDAAGLSLDTLRARAGRGSAGPLALEGLEATLTAPVHVVEDARPPNVVAVVPGRDPLLRDSFVVVSAHMDHVGVGRPDADGDSIHNGADDNASGTAALLEMAQAFAALPPEAAPRRSVVFLAVSGEEKGLLGSRWFTEHPTIPLEQAVANINMDMIGRNAPDSIVVIGQEYSTLGPLVQEVASNRPELGLTVAPDLWPQERFFFRSDHYNFARLEIPALFFFAGVHEDYHRPSDEVEDIDADKAARVARLAFLTAYEIATRDEPPRWTEEGLAEIRALTGGGR